eukprot:m.28133 g.28133  ORF g.28133 m.28133 type:complete len:58 (-) comp11810_c0_seq4:963-1136(-)
MATMLTKMRGHDNHADNHDKPALPCSTTWSTDNMLLMTLNPKKRNRCQNCLIIIANS